MGELHITLFSKRAVDNLSRGELNEMIGPDAQYHFQKCSAAVSCLGKC